MKTFLICKGKRSAYYETSKPKFLDIERTKANSENLSLMISLDDDVEIESTYSC